jgi:uracil-DNA glycosylase
MNISFWSRLTEHRSESIFNCWAEDDPLDSTVCGGALERLERLDQHLDRDARYLLIGEAPGYHGCHFSGIPFTCEKQLCDGIVPGLPTYGRFTTRELPWSEGSATVIWATLHELGIAEHTVMWNSFPYHPHLPGELLSNRTPTPREILDGAVILAIVLAQFPAARKIAVGQIALRTLESLGIAATPVRHPSMGGARQFKEQMREMVRPAAAA